VGSARRHGLAGSIGASNRSYSHSTQEAMVLPLSRIVSLGFAACSPSPGTGGLAAGSGGGDGSIGGATGGSLDGGKTLGTDGTPIDAGSGGMGGMPGVGAAAGGNGGSSTGPFPNCKSVFDGATLNGWLPSSGTGLGNAPGSWDIQDGALHMKGTVRGVLATAADYGDFRFIFSVRKLPKDVTATDHNPCVLLWGHRPPPNDDMRKK